MSSDVSRVLPSSPGTTGSLADDASRRALASGTLAALPKLNLGCGPVQPQGWINVDGSHRAWLAARLSWLDRALTALGILSPTEFGPQVTVVDLSRRLPYEDNSVACIYAGELWEHFEYADAARLTGECFRVLAPWGVLRVCVPDGPAFWGRYLELFREAMSRPRAERRGDALQNHVQMFFNDICTRRIWLGSLGHKHKWQFDEVQLAEMFAAQGFEQVERMALHQSRIPDVHLVERSDFLIVEGVKPAESSG